MPAYMSKSEREKPISLGDQIMIAIITAVLTVMIGLLVQWRMEMKQPPEPVTSSVYAADLTTAPEDSALRGNGKE